MKQIYIFLSFLFAASFLSAQPVVTADILLGVGDEVEVYFSQVEFDPGEAGENVTWDFSSTPFGTTITWSAIDPEATAMADSFPGANLAFLIPPQSATPGLGDGYSFYYSDGNSLEFLGSALVLNPGSAPDTNYLTLTVDGDLLFEFPLHYGDQMSDDIEGINTVFAGGSPFVTQRTGTTTTEVDGYGTLITPLGTFNNVLRVKRTESISDSFMGFATTQDVERYDWYSEDYDFLLYHTEEIVIYDFMGNEQSRTSTTYFSAENIVNAIEEKTAPVELAIFPNPAVDVVNILLSDPEATVQVWDRQGRQVRASQQLAGGQLLVGDLAPGWYQVQVVAGKEIYLGRFLKQ